MIRIFPPGARYVDRAPRLSAIKNTSIGFQEQQGQPITATSRPLFPSFTGGDVKS